ncbi:MAG: hypothetical protein WKG01_21180 [Kofleriaceae bacterium]
MRFAPLWVVLALAGCGKSDAAQGSGSAPVVTVAVDAGSTAPGSAVPAKITDADLERLLRGSVEMFTALGAVPGITCADRATQMTAALDQRKALLAELGQPRPASEDRIDDRSESIAKRTGIKEQLDVALEAVEVKLAGCESDPAIQQVIERVQHSSR